MSLKESKEPIEYDLETHLPIYKPYPIPCHTLVDTFQEQLSIELQNRHSLTLERIDLFSNGLDRHLLFQNTQLDLNKLRDSDPLESRILHDLNASRWILSGKPFILQEQQESLDDVEGDTLGEMDSGSLILDIPFSKESIELSSTCGALLKRWNHPENYYGSTNAQKPLMKSKRRSRASSVSSSHYSDGSTPKPKRSLGPSLSLSESIQVGSSSQMSLVEKEKNSFAPMINSSQSSSLFAFESQSSMVSAYKSQSQSQSQSQSKKKKRKSGF